MARTRVTLYGGLNEIGGNKFLLEEGEDRLLLDFGTSIGARNQFFDTYLKPRTNSVLRDLLRLDLLADIDGLYRADLLEVAATEVDKDLAESAAAHHQRHGHYPVHGVLLTHAHVDHFQDLAFVDPAIPVYCTATTRTMLVAIDDVMRGSVESEVVAVKQRAVGEKGKTATIPFEKKIVHTPVERRIIVVGELEPFRVGPFEATAVPVDHSVPGACAFHIKTPAGRTVFYTGDIRFNGALTARTKALREFTTGLRPDILLTEGTRMDSTAQDSEQEVAKDLNRLIGDCDGLAIAEFGWKDTTRFDTLQSAATDAGRELVISPKLAYLLHRMDHLTDVPSRAIEHYDNVSVYLRRKDSMLYQVGDYGKHEVGYVPDWDNKEVREAWQGDEHARLQQHLTHWKRGRRAAEIREHPERFVVHSTLFEITEVFDLAPPPGSRWIRCLTEPYSDEMTMDLDRQKRWLNHFDLQHNVTTETNAGAAANGTLGGLTHVSGHAAGIDLKPFLQRIEATHVVPIHVEEKNLHHYDGMGEQRWTFEGKGFRQASRGEAVIEI